jgi:hypothetical protein
MNFPNMQFSPIFSYFLHLSTNVIKMNALDVEMWIMARIIVMRVHTNCVGQSKTHCTYLMRQGRDLFSIICIYFIFITSYKLIHYSKQQ